jgi:hypothetical protein
MSVNQNRRLPQAHTSDLRYHFLPFEENEMTDDTPLSGQLLKDLGIIHQHADLEINGTLFAPAEFLVEPPWNTPSRLMQCPIEAQLKEDKSVNLFVIHELLLDHPFTRHINELIHPHEVIVGDVRVPGTWWHAVDLICTNWELLLETREFTTNRDIWQAVTFALGRRGPFGVPEAKKMLAAADAPPPAEIIEVVKQMTKPTEVKPDMGAAFWPINTTCRDHAAVAWMIVFGIDAGWFVYKRKRLEWSLHGRTMHEAVMQMAEAEAAEAEAEAEVSETE